VIPLVVVVILGAAAAALILGQGGAAVANSPSPIASDAAASGQDALPVISGDPLPRFSTTAGDPAIGLVAPTVAGHDDAGTAVDITPGDSPTVVLFAAHWCSHCQRELPVVQAWVDAGGLPADVDLVAVSTAIDPAAPNYPPSAWFERMGWTSPVMVDPTGSVATAYGLSAYPFFVMLDGDGRVVGRTTGEIGTDALERLISAGRSG
jgi:thiol-disulfide isomerase/thioredoxin